MSSRTRALLLAAGWIVAALAAATLHRAHQIDALLAPGRLHGNDFKHLWIGARLLHLGESPYDDKLLFDMARSHGLIGEGIGGLNPYVYLPFTGLMLTPFARFEFPEALRLWFWLNHAFALIAIVALSIHLTWDRARWAAGWLAAAAITWAALSMPFMRQLTAGQLNCALMLALVAALIALGRKQAWLAGFAIAWAALFKINPGLFILYFAWKRAWRPLAWTGAWLLILGGWSLFAVGWRIHLEFLPLLRAMGFGSSTWAEHGMTFHCDVANQAMGSFLLHIFAGGCGTQAWINLGERAANALAILFALGVLAATIFATRRAWDGDGATWRREWALIVTASLLIPSLMWDHCAVQLLPVVMVGVWESGSESKNAARFVPVAVWLVAALLLAWPVSHWDPALHAGWGLVVISVRLWGTLLVFGLLLWPTQSNTVGANEENKA